MSGAHDSASSDQAGVPSPELLQAHEQQLRQLCMGMRASQALYVAVRLEIPDLFSNQLMTGAELARRTHAHPLALRRLLRALVALDVLVELEADCFALRPLGMLLRSDVPGSQRSTVMFLTGPMRWQCWGALLESVRSGAPAADSLLGMPLFDYYTVHPEESQIHDQAMAGFSDRVAGAFLPAYDLSHRQCVVDVGGGSGRFLAQLLRAYPGLGGVLFDLPNVVEHAESALSDAEVTERCTVQAGDFFEHVPSGGDVYLLKNVLHDWDDLRAEKILASCREAMHQQARLVVVECLLPERAQPGLAVDAHLLDLELLTLAPGGRGRSEREMRALLEHAHFEVTKVLKTASAPSIVEARSA